MTDPKRILDVARRGGLERTLLESVGAAEPTEAQCDAAWVALCSHLAIGAAPVQPSGAGPATGHCAGGGAAAEVGGSALLAAPAGAAAIATGAKAAALLGLALFGAVVVVHGSAGRAVHAGSVAEPAATAQGPVARSATEASSETGDTTAPSAIARVLGPAATSEPPLRATLVARRSGAKPSPRPDALSAGTALLAAESALVVAARADVQAGRCNQALEQLQGGDRRFHEGTLYEERQAIRVAALGCAGRAAAAATAAAAFLESYPESPYVAIVRAYAAGD